MECMFMTSLADVVKMVNADKRTVGLFKLHGATITGGSKNDEGKYTMGLLGLGEVSVFNQNMTQSFDGSDAWLLNVLKHHEKKGSLKII